MNFVLIFKAYLNSHFMIKKLLIAGVIVLTCQFAFTCPISDLIKTAGDAKDYPGSNTLIIFDSTQVEMQETGLSYVNSHTLYKVLTTNGAKDLNIVKFGYDPLSAYVDIKKVVVYRLSGEIEEIDVSQVYDYPAPARMIYWGAREKMVEIGRLEPGDAVEVFLFKKGFTYALLQDEDDQYIPPMKGHFYDIVPFWSSDPLLLKYYSLSVPNDKFVQYRFYNGESESSALPVGDRMVYSFTKKDILPLKHEPGMVAYSDVAPKLLISTSPCLL
jgi:hypothetical protein